MTKEEFGNKAASTQELADYFGISKKILRKWHKMIEPELGPRPGHLYPPRQVRVFLKHFGMLVLAWFAKAGDAIASPFRELYGKISNSHQSDTPGIGSVSFRIDDPSLYVSPWGILVSATSAMVYSTLLLAKTFIKNPYSTISGNKLVRAISIVVLIITMGAIVLAGYLYATMMLERGLL